MKKKEIPVFFAVDDTYIPFLAVTIQSLSEKINFKNLYYLRILYTNINEENQRAILKYQNENIKIEFVNVTNHLLKLEGKLLIRDYYSNATYYRILIPNLYPEYNKALYLDSDIVILDDIAKLYNINIDSYLIGAVSENWFKLYPEFHNYAKKVIGLSNYRKYINAGIMLWLYKDMPNNQYFWNIAKKTEFYHYIENLNTKEGKLKGENSLLEFRRIAKFESDCVGNG